MSTHMRYTSGFQISSKNMQKILKIIFFFACMLSYMSNATAMVDLKKYSQSICRPLVKIDNTIITKCDVEEKIKIMKMMGVEISYIDALENIIDERIVMQLMIEKHPAEEFLQGAIDKLAAQKNLLRGDFNNLLKQSHISIQALKRHIASQMIFNEAVLEGVQQLSQNKAETAIYRASSVIKNKIMESDAVMLKPIHRYKFNANSQVQIAEMFVKQNNEKNVSEIINLLKKGVAFSAIHRQFPNDVELPNGDGVLSLMRFKDMSKIYQEVVSNTTLNEVAPPLMGDDRLLFIKLLSVQNAKKIENFVNSEYLSMSYDQKADAMLKNTYAKLVSHSLIQQMRKKVYIQKF